MWFWLFIGLLSVVGYLLAVESNFLLLFGSSPGLDKLENPRSDQASELYTADGQLIGKYFQENRSPVASTRSRLCCSRPWSPPKMCVSTSIPASIPKAIALGRVWHGCERRGPRVPAPLRSSWPKTSTKPAPTIPRACWGYIPVVSTVIAKTKEWLTAMKLEQHYTKEEILAMYLNTVDFGSNSFGIKVAAKTFFNTSPDSLKPEQAALLVGC